MVINSISNEKVQLLRKLRDKKQRDISGLFAVEGYNIIKDMPKHLITALYVAQSKLDKYEQLTQDVDSLVILSDALFDRIADTQSSQGIIAIAKKIDACWDNDSNAIILDGVSDPGNVGTILRTAVSAGVRNFILINSADCYSDKAVRASMGGIFYANVFCLDVAELKGFKQLEGYTLIATVMDGQNIFEIKKPLRYALIMGSEARGITNQLIDLSDMKIAIPMNGLLESLNVAVCCGIAVYLLQNM